mmetsp:Transcript_32497/g.103686  ORF Transcript_32497/g.103686 Transcript_32497/m.103686 type:complete len:232 (-) Transcript_32497:1814-2509(-)
MCDQVPRRAGCAVAQSLSSPYVHLVRIHVNPHPRPPHDPQSTHYSSSGPASPRSLRLTQETRLAGQPTHRPTLPISSLATPPGAFPAHPSQCPAATRRGRIDSPPARFDARGCLFRHPLNARLGPSHELGVAVEHLRDHGCECKQDAGGIHSPRDGDEQHVHRARMRQVGVSERHPKGDHVDDHPRHRHVCEHSVVPAPLQRVERLGHSAGHRHDEGGHEDQPVELHVVLG